MALALEAVLCPVLKVGHPVALLTLICRTYTHACAGKAGHGVLRHVQNQNPPFCFMLQSNAALLSSFLDLSPRQTKRKSTWI